MDEVTFLCDRITILHRGETVMGGTPASVVKKSGKANLEEAYISCIENLEMTEEKNENIGSAV